MTPTALQHRQRPIEEQKNELIHLQFYRWKPRRVVAYLFAGNRCELHCGELRLFGNETVELRRRVFAHREVKRKWWQPRWQLYVLRVTCTLSLPYNHPPAQYSFQLEQGGLYEFNCERLSRRPS